MKVADREKYIERVTSLGAYGGGVAAVARKGGAGVDDAARAEMLRAIAEGEHVELELTVRAFEQTDGSNRNCVRFTPAALSQLAKTAKGMPFLRDHEQSNSLAVAGTILSATMDKGDKISTLMEQVTISAPWAVDLALRGLISGVSIGWRSTGPVMCSACKTQVFDRCYHYPGDTVVDLVDDYGGKKKVRTKASTPGAETVEWIYTSVELIETSICPVPAVKSARIEEIRAAMSATLGGAAEARKEVPMNELEGIAKILGAAAPTEDAIMGRANALKAELQIAGADRDAAQQALATANAELAILKRDALASDRAEFLRSGIAEGKLTPGDGDVWGSLYDADPTAARKMLSVRAPQSATPVGAKLQSAAPEAPVPQIENSGHRIDLTRASSMFGIDPDRAAALRKELDG